MSKKANPTIIGAFIIGAIALTIISLILIGGGKLFRDRQVFVTYFEGSLQGLRVGANVTFRGVRVGQVREVFIRFNESTLEFDSPVIIELEEGAIRTTIADQMRTQAEAGKLFNQLIEKGLRAQLGMESFVTGQLLVDLDYHPDTQPVFRDQDGLFPEVPTVRNDIQQVIDNFHEFFSKLKDIPIDELFDDLTKSINGIEQIVNSPELANTLKGVDKFINSTDTQELTKTLQHSILKLDATMNDIQTIVQNINQRVDPIANNLDATMDEMRIAIVEIQKTFTAVRDTITDENTRHQLNTALKEFSDAARSFRVFVEYLERHPESFISGKPVSQ
jgi:paraquat-inducible protein B